MAESLRTGSKCYNLYPWVSHSGSALFIPHTPLFLSVRLYWQLSYPSRNNVLRMWKSKKNTFPADLTWSPAKFVVGERLRRILRRRFLVNYFLIVTVQKSFSVGKQTPFSNSYPKGYFWNIYRARLLSNWAWKRGFLLVNKHNIIDLCHGRAALLKFDQTHK